MEYFAEQTKKPSPFGHLPLRQRAFLETVLAYYNRGHAVQYDAVGLTIQEKYATARGAVLRQTDYTSPEMATEDDPMYIVCSSFPWEALYDAFGYKMKGNPIDFKSFRIVRSPKEEPLLAFRYNEDDGGGSPEARQAAVEEINRILQPGDILVTGTDKGAHTMVYVGDFREDGCRWLMHCAGKKYDMETGVEQEEHGRLSGGEGAIRIDLAESFLFGDLEGENKAMWPIKTQPRMVVLRPLQCMDEERYPLSPAAQTRLRFPRLSVDRRADCGGCLDVPEGGTVTVSVSLRNCGNRNYTSPLTVTEKIPQGCTLLPESITGGGTVEGDTIRWQKTLLYGEKVTVSYTVEVTAKRGETVSFGGGSVDTIPMSTILVPVGGKPVQARPFAVLKDGEKLCGDLRGAGFARALYKKVLGADVPLPELKELEETLFVKKDVEAAPRPMLHLVKDHPIMIPKFFGGVEVETECSKQRLLTVLTRRLRIGDVVLAENGEKDLGVPDCLVYLGNDRVACAGENGTICIREAGVLGKIFPSRLFMGLRPSLGYDDVARECRE